MWSVSAKIFHKKRNYQSTSYCTTKHISTMADPWCSKTHLDSVVSKFTQLQMNDSQTDVIIRAGSQEIKAHKAVLAASSGYFMSLFTLEFKEKSQSVVTIDYLPCESVMQLLHFSYTASLDLSDENILDIIPSACYLQMEHAIQLSFDYLKTTKRCDVPSHWKLLCEAASLAADHGLSKPFELCLDKIAYWFSAIYKTEMFVSLLPFEILYKMLDRHELTKFRDFETEMPLHEVSKLLLVYRIQILGSLRFNTLYATATWISFKIAPLWLIQQ